jgi:hypothetical protein
MFAVDSVEETVHHSYAMTKLSALRDGLQWRIHTLIMNLVPNLDFYKPLNRFREVTAQTTGAPRFPGT